MYFYCYHNIFIYYLKHITDQASYSHWSLDVMIMSMDLLKYDGITVMHEIRVVYESILPIVWFVSSNILTFFM